MGFSVRKSIGFGPLRLNLTKSGVGVSVGVRGARMRFGPGGSQVQIGRGGITYRQRLGPRHTRRSDVTARTVEESNSGIALFELARSSADESLARINDQLNKRAYAPAVWILTGVIAVGLLGVDWVPALSVLIIGGIAGIVAGESDHGRKTTNLTFDLDGVATSDFDRIGDAWEILSRAQRVWLDQTSTPTSDWKRNAGANNLITRRLIQAGKFDPPFIRTNLTVWGIDLVRGVRAFFFPDRIYIYERSEYKAYRYDSLEIGAADTRFRESDAVPNDTTVIGQTWQYVNRDGGPDRRFANNRQIPIVHYGQVTITSGDGLQIVLSVSNAQIAHRFAEAFRQACHPPRRDPSPPAVPVSLIPMDNIPRQIVLSADELHAYTTAMEGFAKRYARLADEAMRHVSGNVMNRTRRVNIRQVTASMDRLAAEVDKTTIPSSAQFQEQHRAIESSIKVASQKMMDILSVWDPKRVTTTQSEARTALGHPTRLFAILIADVKDWTLSATRGALEP